MRVLGAILAGGRSSRFGSDKALAELGGVSLIDRVAAALGPQVDAVVVCGRAGGVPDRPRAGLGPLGGLNAALHHARAHGFDAVLSVPCDTPFLPGDLRARLAGNGAHYLDGLPAIGWWPASLADALDRFVAEDARRSMRGWAAVAGAVAIDAPEIANVNSREDLDRLLPNRSS